MTQGYIFFVVFMFLWIAPIVAGVIIAKKKNRSPHWFWFGIWPGVGFWVFIIMLFLKPLKICDECERKIPADSVRCPYCSKETNYEINEEAQVKASKEKKKAIIITVAIVVLALAVFAGIMIYAVGSTFKNSEPYKHSIELIESNSEIKEYLGEDYKRFGIITGSFHFNGDGSGDAYFSYKLKGRNGISVVYVDAEEENGIWNYSKINFYKKERTREVINLLEE
ncbi:MAG: hypothetical protein IK024_00210 [Treponema sp.]|nr:hypothetical protein [Treponema sp.]